MRRAEALRILRENEPAWRGLGVARLRLFGSVARDQARDDSDVDVLVEFSRQHSLLEMSRVRRELEALLGVWSIWEPRQPCAPSCGTMYCRRQFLSPRRWQLRLADMAEFLARNTESTE